MFMRTETYSNHQEKAVKRNREPDTSPVRTKVHETYGAIIVFTLKNFPELLLF